MTTNRQWQHGNSVANSEGVAWYSGYAVTGDAMVSGGGYAHLIDYSGSNSGSTDTTGNSASLPLVGMYTSYNSGGGVTNLVVGFAAPPNVLVRVHSFTTWES